MCPIGSVNFNIKHLLHRFSQLNKLYAVGNISHVVHSDDDLQDITDDNSVEDISDDVVEVSDDEEPNARWLVKIEQTITRGMLTFNCLVLYYAWFNNIFT